ncbi:hypothetical protein C6503_01635 [Candidatus Poribacteria bacterium]|nr:MAG: hypothetical protein C6503_01635 [Candidatus Poribacteria bacterium]
MDPFGKDSPDVDGDGVVNILDCVRVFSKLTTDNSCREGFLRETHKQNTSHRGCVGNSKDTKILATV